MDGKSVRRATLAECLASIEGFGPLNGVNTCVGTLRDLLVASASENPCSAFLGGKRCEYPKEHAPLLLHRVGRHTWVDCAPNDLEISKYADMCDAAAKLLSDATGLEVYRHSLVEGIEILLGKRKRPSMPLPSRGHTVVVDLHPRIESGGAISAPTDVRPPEVKGGLREGDMVCIERIIPEQASPMPGVDRKQKVVEQLCKMMGRAWTAIDPNGHKPCDCVCGREGTYQNAGHALTFMEEAISEAIARHERRASPSSSADKPANCVEYDVRIRVQGPKTFTVRALIAEPDIRLLPRELFRESGCASNVVLDPVPAVPASPSSSVMPMSSTVTCDERTTDLSHGITYHCAEPRYPRHSTHTAAKTDGSLYVWKVFPSPTPAPSCKAIGTEIVEWLGGLEYALIKTIRDLAGPAETEHLRARRGIYTGIADDIKRKWPALFTSATLKEKS